MTTMNSLVKAYDQVKASMSRLIYLIREYTYSKTNKTTNPFKICTLMFLDGLMNIVHSDELYSFKTALLCAVFHGHVFTLSTFSLNSSCRHRNLNLKSRAKTKLLGK